MRVTLRRNPSRDFGTFGHLSADDFVCHTLELPWRDNRVRRSCIPSGRYECAMVRSPKFGKVYHVRAVPGRSHILIHAGNLGGDVELGYRSNILGCILLGQRVGTLGGQPAVLISRPAISEFVRSLEAQPFDLEVSDA